MKEHHEQTGSWSIKESSIRRELTKLKKSEDYAWLKEVGCNVIKQSIKDAGTGLDRFKRALEVCPDF